MGNLFWFVYCGPEIQRSGQIKAANHKQGVQSLTLFRPGFFIISLGTTEIIISGTIQAIPMKLCTVIVLLKAYQNILRKFQKSDL